MWPFIIRLGGQVCQKSGTVIVVGVFFFLSWENKKSDRHLTKSYSKLNKGSSCGKLGLKEDQTKPNKNPQQITAMWGLVDFQFILQRSAV